MVNSLFAQNNARRKIEEAILHLDLQKANQLITYEYNETFKAYFYHHVGFLRQFLYEGKNNADFFTSSDQWIRFVQNRKNEPWKLPFLGEMYIERALLKFWNKSYFDGFKDFREAFKISKQIEKSSSTIKFSYRLSGFCDVFLGSIPSKYKWAADFLGYSGDIQRGMKKLNLAIQTSEIFRYETQILMFYLEKHLLHDPLAAWERIDSLANNYPDNYFYAYLLGINALDRRDNPEAKSNLMKAFLNLKVSKFEYPAYHLAHTYLFEEKHDSAVFYFQYFLNTKEGNFMKPDAMFKLGIIYSIENQQEVAKKWFYKATQFGEQISDKDIYAIKKSKELILKPLTKDEIILFRSRWLFDGGFFQKSLNVLQEMNSRNFTLVVSTRTELFYRMGRNYHEKGSFTNAKLYYRLSLQQNDQKNLWMRAYSAFYIAQIFESQENWSEARRYYEIALSFKNYDFQSSLEQKAKASLARTNQKANKK